MEFKELVKRRQSDRAYLNAPIEKEKIESVLEAARLSPSAQNAQGWSFVVIDDAEMKNRASACAYRMGGAFMKQAPVIIAVVAEKPLLMQRLGSAIKKIDIPSLDMGIVAAHICLQAADLGLGSCMLQSFDEKRLKTVLDIPKNRRIALVITLGYSADEPREKKRKELREIVRWNHYTAK